MLRFLRKIRKDALSRDNFRFYAFYAIGEIILVVIGILIALSINNWNERRKDQRLLDQVYRNLEANLKTDSLALASIIIKTENSLKKQELIISTPSEEIYKEYSPEELEEMVRIIWAAVYSFHPKLGIYNQILAGNVIDLIKSNDIKENLWQYYDYRCKRYSSIDQVMDEKYHEFFQDFMARDLKMNFHNHFDASTQDLKITIALIDELKYESRKLYDLSYNVLGILLELKKDIDSLLVMVRKEIDRGENIIGEK